MLLLLPPSETKRPGGEKKPLDFEGLEFPVLREARERVARALVDLAGDETQAQRVLKLSDRQRGQIASDRELFTAPTMAAVDRYTGVLYDALEASSLDPRARAWLGRHVRIHSALFGLISALDPIPEYRLSGTVTLPGLPPLRRVWQQPIESALLEQPASFILDLRSEAYVALGAIPGGISSAYVRVVADEVGGTRALNHFNKRGKGYLVRMLAQLRPRVRTVSALLRWAGQQGVALRATSDPAIVELVAET